MLHREAHSPPAALSPALDGGLFLETRMEPVRSKILAALTASASLLALVATVAAGVKWK